MIPTIEELVEQFRHEAGPDFDLEFATMLATAAIDLIRKGQVYYDREAGTLETIKRN